VTSQTDDVVVLPDETTFYLSKDDQTFGPHSVTEIQSFLKSGAVFPNNLLWTEGMEEWTPIGQLFQTLAPVEKPVRPNDPATQSEVEPAKKREDGESLVGPWEIARARSDGMSNRLSVAILTAAFLHLVLLATLTLGASTFFKLNTEVTTAPAPEEPPMDVTLVTEDDPPLPQDTPPPPPPDDPPPPPALPDIPLPTVMQPPSPVPLNISEPVAPPVIAPSTLPVLATPAPKPAKVRRAAPVASAPQPAPVADASPSDYLDAPPPIYPYQARETRQEGTVVLLVVINDAGEPVRVVVGQSSGYPILDSVAQHQVADHFRFKVGNSRVLRVPIDFHL
jgi:periplasmic protein TonB